MLFRLEGVRRAVKFWRALFWPVAGAKNYTLFAISRFPHIIPEAAITITLWPTCGTNIHAHADSFGCERICAPPQYTNQLIMQHTWRKVFCVVVVVHAVRSRRSVPFGSSGTIAAVTKALNNHTH